MERFAHLSVNWCFSASIGSFQGLPAELSEVILLSQRLALKYNTTPRGACQHFLTSFFQFLCGTENALSGAPAPDSPFCRCATSSPEAGEVFPQRGSQAVKFVAKVLGIARRFPAVLLALPLRKDFPRSGGRCRAAPERVRPYIITLYRQCEAQAGIDCGLYYPPESVLRCQEFPCKILSRKISAIFGDCYKTQNIVVFCLTCH